MRRTLLSALVVALLLGGLSTCPAQTTSASTPVLKPLVTVSFSGYDELRADIDYVGKLGDSPQTAQQLEALLSLVTQGQGLAGLDKTKPWGAVIQTDGQQQFPIYGFIPVTDLKQLMGLVGSLGVEVSERAAGIYEIPTDGPTIVVRQKGGWALIAAGTSDPAGVPADPQKMLGGLNEKYDLAVRASVRNVPPMFRQMFTDQLRAGVEIGLPQMPGESDADFAVRQGIVTQSLKQIETLLGDLDEVLVGWAIDRQAGTSSLEVQTTAVAGSTTAAQFADAAEAKTNFAGFDLPGAALTGNWAGKLADSDVAQAKSALAAVRTSALKNLEDEGLSEEELKLASQVLSDLVDVLEKTVENKDIDGGMALLLKPDGLTLVAGSVIADGDKLEKTLKQMAGEMQKAEPTLAQAITFDAETHQGVRFHKLAVPTAEMGDEAATKLFGQQLDVIVGISPESVYLALGRDASGTLKQAIDASKAQAGKEILPMRIALSATPIAKFLAQFADDEATKQMAAMAAGVLEKSTGKDHLILTSRAIPNGATVRLEMEEGLLRLIGSLGNMMGMMMGGAGM